MNIVIRSIAVYLVLLTLLRISGRRTLSKMTNFDFVLLLIIGSVAKHAVIKNEYSFTATMIVIVTFIVLNVAFSMLKLKFRRLSRWIDGQPMVLVEDGKPLTDLMEKARVTEDDILSEARRMQGLQRMDQIRFAVLEVTGKISIIPK